MILLVVDVCLSPLFIIWALRRNQARIAAGDEHFRARYGILYGPSLSPDFLKSPRCPRAEAYSPDGLGSIWQPLTLIRRTAIVAIQVGLYTQPVRSHSLACFGLAPCFAHN